MKEETQRTKPESSESPNAKHSIRLPGFVVEKDIGLGDVIKKVTYRLGFTRPCEGCQRRAETLNRWVRFTR